MIKTYIGRAMMVSMLEEPQLINLQDIEKAKGYLIPNWNIQTMYGLSSIKDRYGIPDDSIEQNSHNKRIMDEIDRLHLKSIDELFPEGLDWIHAFDWNIMAAKNKIVWDFVGAGKRGNIKDLLKVLLVTVFSQRVISMAS